MTDQVVLEEDDGVLRVTLNRPEKLNAVNRHMSELLHQAVWRLGDREDLRVMVITGVGRFFTAGQEINPEAIDAAPRLRLRISDKLRAKALLPPGSV